MANITKEYVTADGETKVYQYDYTTPKSQRKKRKKCPTCGNYLYRITTTSPKSKVLGFYCHRCDITVITTKGKVFQGEQYLTKRRR